MSERTARHEVGLVQLLPPLAFRRITAAWSMGRSACARVTPATHRVLRRGRAHRQGNRQAPTITSTALAQPSTHTLEHSPCKQAYSLLPYILLSAMRGIRLLLLLLLLFLLCMLPTMQCISTLLVLRLPMHT